MNSKKIKEIEERVEKATPGTWKVEKYYHDEPYEKYIKLASIVCRNQTITRNDWSNPVEADLDFIAHARQDIPYLLKIINELNDEKLAIQTLQELLDSNFFGVLQKMASNLAISALEKQLNGGWISVSNGKYIIEVKEGEVVSCQNFEI